MDEILILHNTFGPKDDPHYQSRAGVYDQVVAVEQSCKKLGINYTILPVEDLKQLINTLNGRKEKIIFNLIEEFPQSIQQACFVPAICESLGKSCTGNSAPALLLAQNKFQAKAVLTARGLSCPSGAIFPPDTKFNPNLLKKGKYIIKPALSDASEGITLDSVVQLPDEKDKAKEIVRSLQQKFNQPVIVEQFIAARELNVSVLQRNGNVDVLPIAEIDFSAFSKDQPRIIDYSAKWEKESFAYNNTPRKIPADLDNYLSQQIEKFALAAWQALDCRDYIRVDFRLDENDKPYIIEVNPNPDITPDAGFAAALSTAGIPYELFIFAIIENAKQRFKG